MARRHLHRGPDYSPSDYATEFGIVAQAVAQDSNIPTKNNLIGPSVASGPWKPEDVWATGFIQNYQDVLGALAVEQCVDLVAFLILRLTPHTAILITIVRTRSPTVDLELRRTRKTSSRITSITRRA